MKKIITLIAAIAVILIPFSGCKKFIDHIFHRDTTIVGDCRIAKVIQNDELTGEPRTGIVYYNEHNDPDSVIFDGDFYGPTLFYFYYNDHHQLVEYREDYDNVPDFISRGINTFTRTALSLEIPHVFRLRDNQPKFETSNMI